MATTGNSGYKNIDYCVRLVQNDLNDFSMHNYARLSQLAYNIFRDLNLLAMPSIKVAHVTPNEINCINFDSMPGYEDYVKIGICLGGRLYTLTRNDNLCLNRTRSCGIETLDTLNQDINCGCYDWGYYFAPHWYGASWLPKLYGMGGGINNLGYYRIDYEMRRIQFNSIVPQTEMVIEYKSNGLEPDGSAVVPGAFVMAMAEGIHWKNVEYDKRISLGEKQRRFEMYDMELNKAVQMTNSFTIDEYFDATYENMTASVHR